MLRVLAVLGTGVVDPTTPVVRADDPGVTRGDGCFEGCRLLTAGDGATRIDKLDAHLARFARSAFALQIPFDEPAWRQLLALVCAEWRTPGEAALKLVLTRGPDGAGPVGFATVTELTASYSALRASGLRAITLARGYPDDAFAEAPWLLGGVKTLSYAVNMAALREAERRGADDVIFISAGGHVLESPTGTVVWSHGTALRTTPLGATGILGGTTQQRLFDAAADAGWDVGEELITADELHTADSVWLVSSVRGPVDVIELDGKSRERDRARNDEIARLAGFPSR